MVIKKGKLKDNYIKIHNPNIHLKEVKKDGKVYIETYGYIGPKFEYIKEMLSFDGQDMAMTPIIKLNYIDPEEAKTMTAEEIKARATSGSASTSRSGTNCSIEVWPTGTLNQFGVRIKMWSSSTNWWNHFSHFQGYVLGSSKVILGGYYNYGNGLPTFTAGNERVQEGTFSIGGNTNIYGCSGCAECNKGWGYDDSHVDAHLNAGWWSDGVSWAATSSINMTYTNPVVKPGAPSVSFSFDKNSPTKVFSSVVGNVTTWPYFNDADVNNVKNNYCNFTFRTGNDAKCIIFRLQYWRDNKFNDAWRGVSGMTAVSGNATFSTWLRCNPNSTYTQRVLFDRTDASRTAWRVGAEVSSVTSGHSGESTNSCGWQYFSVNQLPSLDSSKVYIEDIEPGTTATTKKITPDEFTIKWEQSTDTKDMTVRKYRFIYRTRIDGGEWGSFLNDKLIVAADNATSHTLSMHSLGINENYWINLGIMPGDDLDWDHENWYWNNLVELHNSLPILTNPITADADSFSNYFVKNIKFTLPKITDRQSSYQTLVYQIQKRIKGGTWEDYDLNYASSNTTITIDAGTEVGNEYDASFEIRVRGYDGLEYSGWVYSKVYKRNTPPQGTITIKYHPQEHLSTHSEYIDYIDWNHLTDNVTKNNVLKYIVKLYNGTTNNLTAVNKSVSVVNNKWTQNITHLTRGSYFKYSVQAVDKLGEKSPEFFGSTLIRNREPGVPGAPKSTYNATELYVKVDNPITWTASVDPDNDNVTYQLQYKTDLKDWSDLAVDLPTNSYTLKLNPWIADNETTFTMRVRAKDVHGVYSAWSSSSTDYKIVRLPATPTVYLEFAKNVSKQFNGESFNTYCFYNDINDPNVINNVCSVTFTLGKYTESCKFILQYFESGNWHDDNRNLTGSIVTLGGAATFNSWLDFTSGSNIQKITFSKTDAAKQKWRVQVLASSQNYDQKFENWAESNIIEFAVNSLPIMDSSTLKILPINVAGSSVTNITTDKMTVQWGASVDTKNMTLRRYRLKFKTKSEGGIYGNYSNTYIDCTQNSLSKELSLHSIGIPENNWIELAIQPGDDLDWDWEVWYNNNAEELHNTPPKLVGQITSDLDAYYKFRDNINFTLPNITDPQSDKQTLTYDIQTKVNGGNWADYKIGYTSNLITIDAGTLVGNISNSTFAIRTRAFDGMEYSDWVESEVYSKNQPPTETITIDIYPAAHKSTHAEYVEYCYWNSIKDTTTGDPINSYNVWLYKSSDLSNPIFQDTVTDVLKWYKDIKNYTNEDNEYIARGQNFKYAVQAIDSFGETSDVYYSNNFIRNRAPSAPGAISIVNAEIKTFETTTVKWGASTDPDGDSLTYELQFSPNGIDWSNLILGTPDTNYSHVIGDIVNGSVNSCYYRVRAKDEHGIYSPWTQSSQLNINSAPDVPVVTLRFEKNVSMVFNGVNTYCFFNDLNVYNITQNQCIMTFTPGKNTVSSNFRLQYFDGTNWVDDSSRNLQGIIGKFNQWNSFNTDTSVQTTYFSLNEAKIKKWRIWMQCCSVNGASSNNKNTSVSNIIEFSVNNVPVMDENLSYIIPYPTLDGLNNITDNLANVTWNMSTDNKDMTNRKYRLHYRTKLAADTSYGSWNTQYINCTDNSTNNIISMHDLAINEDNYINLQIQPGDDLEWNYTNWYGNIEIMHNTPPRLSGRITSDMDTYHKFKDNIEFTLPNIIDPQSSNQSLTYEIQTKVDSGNWTNYQIGYASNSIIIDAGTLVSNISNSAFSIRVRAFDEIEYSDWIESDIYYRNAPPVTPITVDIYPAAHKSTHAEYVDYCYWNSIKDTATGLPIKSYNVWLYNSDDLSNPIFQDTVTNALKWYQDIKNYTNEDNEYIARGESFKYAVQAIDSFGETSTVYYSNNFLRNRAPSAPASISTTEAELKTFYTTTVNWDASIDPDGDSLTYELQISTDGTSWIDLDLNISGTTYSHVIGDIVDGSVNSCYYRVRAKDEHGIYSPWTQSSRININSAPDAPVVTLRFDKNVSMVFNGVNTYCFFNDINIYNITQNQCIMTFTPGKNTVSSNFRLQYFDGSNWVDDFSRNLQGIIGTFNQWNDYNGDTSTQTTYFSLNEAKISKWRIWMQCCSVNGTSSNNNNTSVSNIIEFSVNNVPVMDENLSYIIPYPTLDGLNNITDDLANVTWNMSTDNKDVVNRKYRLHYRTKLATDTNYGSWNTQYINCTDNSTNNVLSMHNLGINENNYINLQIQPGDDLEWNYLNWYGDIEIVHNTPPKLSGQITSDMDTYHKFKDNIEFTLPNIIDPQSSRQSLTYEIQTKVDSGNWTNYQIGYVSNSIIIDGGTLVSNVPNASLIIRVRAFDEIEYSDWIESDIYYRNAPPITPITVEIYPAAHKSTHSEYVDYCYWNSVKDTATGLPIKSYNVWLYNSDDLSNPIFQDTVTNVLKWYQDIKNYTNEDNEYIARGQYFKYAVQAIDAFGETSIVYYSNNFLRNRAPSAPASISTTEPELKTFSTTTVNWDASIDLDNDILVYELQFSADGTSWIDLDLNISETTYSHIIGDVVDGSVNECYYRVRAKDEHGIYSPWTQSSKININSAPSVPKITLRFEKNVSMVFNGVNTYCFYNDINIYNITQNQCIMTFTPGNNTFNSNFRLQYFDGANWVDDFSRNLQGIIGTFNQWTDYKGDTSTQTTYFSDSDAKISKWRIWMQCCSVNGVYSNSKNTSVSNIIEFSVNNVPVMDENLSYIIPYPTLDGLNNITDNLANITWNMSTDNKDVVNRKYRLRYRIESGVDRAYSDWSTQYIECTDNSTNNILSLHDLSINENTYINLQIQPGDDLEWNYLNWYGNIEIMHNTPPIISGAITSDQDSDHVFKDWITFDLPAIIDPQRNRQNLVFDIYVNINDSGFVKNTTLTYTDGCQFIVDANALVSGQEGAKFQIGIVAFDQVEYSDMLVSSIYYRNTRPKADDINVFYYPSDHNGHNEYIDYIKWTYNKTTPNTIVDHYEMYLFNNSDLTTPLFTGISTSEKVWYQEIKDYTNEDNAYIPRGESFAYGVRVYDQYGEFSDIKYGKILVRNQKPETPANVKIDNVDNEVCMFGSTTILWDKSIDPDNGDSDTLKYEVQASSDNLNWVDVELGISENKCITEELDNLIDNLATKIWFRVRAQDEHLVYSDWGYSPIGYDIIRMPSTPEVILTFDNPTSIKFGSNTFDTYCYYKITGNDADGFELVDNNVFHATYINGTSTRSIKLYLQYYENSTWKDIDFDNNLAGNLTGYLFNQWINITTFSYAGISEQIKTINLQYAEKRKFRIWMQASAMKDNQNDLNSVDSNIIEFSVNLVPVMDESQIKIEYNYTNMITDNYCDLTWEESEDPKDIMIRNYRIRYCIGDYNKNYGNYSIVNVLNSDINVLNQKISMHELGVPENSWIKFQIQPGDDLEYNYENWYGRDIEICHNTPPKFADGMTITSDQDNDFIFKDNIEFYLPTIIDPEDDVQDLTYQIQKNIGGQWTNYELNYPHNPVVDGTINDNKTRITIDCDYLVNHVYGAEIKFRIRAFDGVEYSEWLESNSYFRNVPPYGIMEIEYDPEVHLNYDNDHNPLLHHEYIDCCYWNFVSQNNLTMGLENNNIIGYNVWLLTAIDKNILKNLNISSVANIVDKSGLLSVKKIDTNPNYNVDLFRYEWPRGIDDITRGNYYKYIVQVEDIYGEKSEPYNGPIYYRNRAPLKPDYVKVINDYSGEICINSIVEFNNGIDLDFDELRYQLEFSISYDGINFGIPDVDDNIVPGSEILVDFEHNELLEKIDDTFRFNHALVDVNLNSLIKQGAKIKYMVCAVDEHDIKSDYTESVIYTIHIQPRGAILKYPGIFTGINDDLPMPIVYNKQSRLLLEMNKDIDDYYLPALGQPIDTDLELIITHKYKVEETDEYGNTIEVEKSEEYRSFSSDYFNTDKYNDGDRAKYKCFNELKIGENIIEVKTFDGIQDSKINVYKIELKEPEQEFLKQEDHSIIWNSISENIKLMITNIYNSYGECEHYDNGGYNYDINDYEMNFGIGETVIPDGYNNMAWNTKKINDFINNYCDGFEYKYNDVFFVSIEDFTLTEQINLLLKRVLEM